MNRTALARRIQIINAMVEGNSIRSTERMTDTPRDTIMRLTPANGGLVSKIGCGRLRNWWKGLRGKFREQVSAVEKTTSKGSEAGSKIWSNRR
ncbi:MAG TPA: hypothetical protein VHX61_01285 [Rhizomicrobium sp.]|jgi:hypothetical protein|nr:hypothetical protein [Rhizomicrobium sp.]